MDLLVEAVQDRDVPMICGIYNHYVGRTTASFELQPVGEELMRGRIETIALTLPWLVLRRRTGVPGEILGYAFAAPWKPREAYRQTVETSIYLSPDCVGQGLGRSLYAELLRRLTGLGMHSAIASIALPNDASVRFHESLGFVSVGRLREAGFKFGRWIDMGYWQRML